MSQVSQRVKNACALIRTGRSRGTGYLVAPGWILTCAHVVADEPIGSMVDVLFQPEIDSDTIRKATIFDRDIADDVAILRLDETPDSVEPLRFTDLNAEDSQWQSFGYPFISNNSGMVLEGKINDIQAIDPNGKPAIQLWSDHLASGSGGLAHGWSGSPVLVGDAVIGHLKSIIPNQESTGRRPRAEMGTVYAVRGEAVKNLLPDEARTWFSNDPCNQQELIDAIWKYEVERPALMGKILRILTRSEPVVVLSTNRGGSSCFIAQLAKFIRDRRRDWNVVSFSVLSLPEESGREYSARMNQIIDEYQSTSSTLVCCIHGFSGLEIDLVKRLGAILRAKLDSNTGPGPDDDNNFRLVAVGSYALYLLRYGPDEMSWLNIASQEDIPELTLEDIKTLLDAVHPQRWSTEDAQMLYSATGGHPYLTKLILSRLYEDCIDCIDSAAHEVVTDINFYLRPQLHRYLRNKRTRDIIRQCCERAEGIRFPFGRYERDENKLFFHGFFDRSKDNKRLTVRCPALRELMIDLIDDFDNEPALN